MFRYLLSAETYGYIVV